MIYCLQTQFKEKLFTLKPKKKGYSQSILQNMSKNINYKNLHLYPIKSLFKSLKIRFLISKIGHHDEIIVIKD